jgi:hypothetical protein
MGRIFLLANTTADGAEKALTGGELSQPGVQQLESP